MEKTKQEFATTLIEAIAENSAEKLYPLCNNYNDMKKYDTSLGLTEARLNEIVMSNCSKFLETVNFNISEYNLETTTLSGVNDAVEIVKGHSVIFASSICLKFIKKSSSDKFRIDISSPIIIDDQIKINNPLMIEFREFEEYVPVIRPDVITVTDSNGQDHELPFCDTSFIKESLKQRNVYIEGCAGDVDWYIHDGDLELDSFTLKHNTIITGDLSIHEPVVNFDVSLIVLGKTTVNALIVDEVAEVFLLGGIYFNVALLIWCSGNQMELRDLNGPLADINSETAIVEGEINTKYYNHSEYGPSHGVITKLTELIKNKYIVTDDDDDDDDDDDYEEIDQGDMARDIKLGLDIFNDPDVKESFINVIFPDLKDRETIISLLKEDGLYLEKLDENLRADKELIDIALERNITPFKYIAESLKEDDAYIYELIKKKGRVLEFLSDRFKKDKELVLLAINSSPYAFDDAHKSLKADKEVVLYAINKNAKVFEYVDESLQTDEDVLLAVINNNPDAFKYAPESIVDNEKIILELVKKAPKYLSSDLLESYRKNKLFITKVLEENPNAFNYLGKKLQEDKDIRSLAGRV